MAFGSSSKGMARGLRNNNPLNIVYSERNHWVGLVPDKERKDPVFCEFTSMEFGIRAALVLLRNYITIFKKCTLREIISRWAPANENPTEEYVKFVAFYTGINADVTISFSDFDCIINIVLAMAKFESGAALSYEQVFDVYCELFPDCFSE